MAVPEESTCIIETREGPVSGLVYRSDDGSQLYKFMSIPYATPPLGHLRFLAPTPVKPWTEIINCTEKKIPLRTVGFKSNFMLGAEDCLYIDIITPSIKNENPLPVMFWVGNYAFAYCIDGFLDSTLFNEHGVIFVRCDFRLGPFGFLSVNDITAPGNNGLKDIVMALKWVQNNISAFGGDPNNVTLFGSSSGRAIVHLMLLSPMATGLFHKAIIQCASALNSWALDKNPSNTALRFANFLGINKTNKTAIVDELRSMSVTDITEGFCKMMEQDKLDENNDLFDAIFKPCIEVEFEGQPAFLTKSPVSLLKSNNFIKIPLIIGSNLIEASILQCKKQDYYDGFDKFNKNPNLLVPKSLAAEPKISKTIGQELLKFYLGGEEQLTENTKTQFLQLVSDYYFLYYVNKTLRLHSQRAPDCPIYYYILNYAGEWDVPKELALFNTMGHSAEISFLFQLKLPDKLPCRGSKDSVVTRSRMVKMWTNFAKYGNPTPDENDPLLQIKWDAVENPNKLNYLSIGSELTKGTNPFRARMEFWDNLHKEHTFLRALVYVNDLGVTW